MHGIILAELKKFVEVRLSAKAWDALIKSSGIGPKIYLFNQDYPDEEARAIIMAIATKLGKPAPVFLEEFGEFIVPDLVGMYKHLIKPSWKTLDVIEHTEETIHKLVRLRNSGAKPPELQCERVDPQKVLLTYSSQRKMCAIAKGIAKGLARTYDEKVLIADIRCMLLGDPSCLISIQVVS